MCRLSPMRIIDRLTAAHQELTGAMENAERYAAGAAAIAGGSGGIGQAIARTLAESGADIAVTYNRKRRTMRTVTSELLKIPGIGPVKRRRLLQEFGSIQGVREASEEAIARVPGFNAAQAKRL